MRRLAVILCFLGMLGTLVVAHAPAAPTADPLDFAIVGIDARVGGDAVRSSGVVIDANAGLVLTSAHSVWGATSLRLTTGVGVLHGRVVARAPCTDLAVLELQPRIPGLMAPHGGGALAHPLNAVMRASDGRVVHRGRPLPAAASGAPVVDADGHVAGIVEAASGRRSTVVPWPLIHKRLGELQPGPRRVFVGWRDEYRCAPAMHAFAKARHPRYRAVDAVLNAPVPATRVPGTEGLDR